MTLSIQPLFRALAVGACLITMGSRAVADESQFDLMEAYRSGSPDTAFMEDIQQRAVLYFLEQTDVNSGLTRDRAPADGGESLFPASIAASGFALTSWCVADARGWMPAGEAVKRTLTTLRFAFEHVAHEHGWFYHFIDVKTGKRVWESEASTIDTAIFLKGVGLACAGPISWGCSDWAVCSLHWQWLYTGNGSFPPVGWHEGGFAATVPRLIKQPSYSLHISFRIRMLSSPVDRFHPSWRGRHRWKSAGSSSSSYPCCCTC